MSSNFATISFLTALTNVTHRLTCSFDFRLKLHTRVMLLHNVDTNRGLVNGQTGLVVGFQAPAGKVHRTRLGQMKLGNDEAADSKLRGAYDSWYRENGIDQAEPSGKGKEKAKEEPVRQNFLPVVKWDNGDTSLVEPHYWRIEDHRGRLRAWRIQLPLRHAWAFSIHKSQGLSLDSVVVDLGNCFTDGMAYVALSRCRFLETLFIRGQFRKDAIRASENVSRFYGHESQLARYRRGTGGMASAGPALPPRRAAELSSSPVKLGYSRPQLRTTSAPAVSVAPERAREEPATASAILLCESSDHEDDDRGATAQTNRMQTVHELSSEDGVICIEDSESDSDADSDVLEEGSPVRRPAQAGTSSSPYDPDAAAAAYTVTLSQLRTSFSKPPSASPPNTNPPLKKRRY